MESKIIHFDKSQINEANHLLGRAFYNDPAYTYIILEEGNRRERLVGWLCTLTVRYGLAFGHVYTTDNSLKGVAIWIPSDAFSLSFIPMIKIGMYVLPFQLGFSAVKRVIKLLNNIEKHHKLNMPEKHWYLSLLGVDPVYQNQGIGSSLLQPILKQADVEGLPCYLETFTEKNVRFYHKHGFAVVTEVNISKSNLRFWTMKRKPQN
ncbi:hypothetical protein WA1_20020 [Scytonema hofmannii PCC 7110]|uniref:N-acetyltransferase domain-containing protein n=1 Tax=Scytonema hofmannii PCC 7110 TaxID=128403 RepID=A0A139XC43_9CYAN|nr:GNAT family N-acetyltransferase [Scytonema hofmannii]KYC42267.1 hypothetical protein WA1_20020 [Scytonema hofmannii PCC 7110]